MDSLDLDVQNRIGGIKSRYVSKPHDFQPEEKYCQTENKKTFDKSYCKTVQAYFAPNFIKTGEKPCSVSEYIARLQAAGLQEGKDFVVEGRDFDYGYFALDVILKDSLGRDKQCTTWGNGLEKSNYQGYEKYTYNPFDSSYRKTSTYSEKGELLYSSEITNAIEQKEFTEFGLNYKTKPKDYIKTLKENGRKYKVSKDVYGDNNEEIKLTVVEFSQDDSPEKVNMWHLVNNKLAAVVQDNIAGDGIKCERRIVFNPDGSTEVTRYIN